MLALFDSLLLITQVSGNSPLEMLPSFDMSGFHESLGILKDYFGLHWALAPVTVALLFFLIDCAFYLFKGVWVCGKLFASVQNCSSRGLYINQLVSNIHAIFPKELKLKWEKVKKSRYERSFECDQQSEIKGHFRKDNDAFITDLTQDYFLIKKTKKIKPFIYELISEGGSGKTITLASIFYAYHSGLDCCSKASRIIRLFLRHLSIFNKKMTIPIYIELRDANYESSNYILGKIRNLSGSRDSDLKSLDDSSNTTFFELAKNRGYKFLFLLDGFNEISSPVVQEGIMREIIKLSQIENVCVIVSSRYNLPRFSFSEVRTVKLQQLSEDEVKNRLKRDGISYEYLRRENRELWRLLRNSLFLECYINLQKQNYGQTHSFSDKIELLSSYYKTCVEAASRTKSQETIPMVRFIYYVFLPAVANYMEKHGQYCISSAELNILLEKLVRRYNNRLVEDKSAKDSSSTLCHYWCQALSISLSQYQRLCSLLGEKSFLEQVSNLVIGKDTALVTENNTQYSFDSTLQHQIFRDYLSAVHIYNQINEKVMDDQSELVTRRIPLDIRIMVGQLFKEHVAQKQWEEQNVKERPAYFSGELCTILNSLGKPRKYYQDNDSPQKIASVKYCYKLAVAGILDIIRTSRRGLYAMEMRNLDLSAYLFNRVQLFRQLDGKSYPCRFIDCRMFPFSFYPHGHSRAILCMTQLDRNENGSQDYIVTGGRDGCVFFWDPRYRYCRYYFRLNERIKDNETSSQQSDEGGADNQQKLVTETTVLAAKKGETSSQQSDEGGADNQQNFVTEITALAAKGNAVLIGTISGTVHLHFYKSNNTQVAGMNKHDSKNSDKAGSAKSSSVAMTSAIDKTDDLFKPSSDTNQVKDSGSQPGKDQNNTDQKNSIRDIRIIGNTLIVVCKYYICRADLKVDYDKCTMEFTNQHYLLAQNVEALRSGVFDKVSISPDGERAIFCVNGCVHVINISSYADWVLYSSTSGEKIKADKTLVKFEADASTGNDIQSAIYGIESTTILLVRDNKLQIWEIVSEEDRKCETKKGVPSLTREIVSEKDPKFETLLHELRFDDSDRFSSSKGKENTGNTDISEKNSSTGGKRRRYRISAAAFSPDNEKVVFADDQYQVWEWDIRNDLWSIRDHHDRAVTQIMFSRYYEIPEDIRTEFPATDVTVPSSHSDSEPGKTFSAANSVTPAQYANPRADKWFFSCSRDGTIIRWDAKRTISHISHGSFYRYTKLYIDYGANALLTPCSDGSVKFFDLNNKELKYCKVTQTHLLHKKGVNSIDALPLEASADGSSKLKLVTCSDDGTVTVIDRETWEVIASSETEYDYASEHNQKVNFLEDVVAIDPTHFASISHLGEVLLWTMEPRVVPKKDKLNVDERSNPVLHSEVLPCLDGIDEPVEAGSTCRLFYVKDCWQDNLKQNASFLIALYPDKRMHIWVQNRPTKRNPMVSFRPVKCLEAKDFLGNTTENQTDSKINNFIHHMAIREVPNKDGNVIKYIMVCFRLGQIFLCRLNVSEQSSKEISLDVIKKEVEYKSKAPDLFSGKGMHAYQIVLFGNNIYIGGFLEHLQKHTVLRVHLNEESLNGFLSGKTIDGNYIDSDVVSDLFDNVIMKNVILLRTKDKKKTSPSGRFVVMALYDNGDKKQLICFAEDGRFRFFDLDENGNPQALTMCRKCYPGIFVDKGRMMINKSYWEDDNVDNCSVRKKIEQLGFCHYFELDDVDSKQNTDDNSEVTTDDNSETDNNHIEPQPE